MLTYTARATRWERGWEIHVGDIGVTQSRGTADAYRMAADLIETVTDQPSSSFAVEITFRFEPGQRRPKRNDRTWIPWPQLWQRMNGLSLRAITEPVAR